MEDLSPSEEKSFSILGALKEISMVASPSILFFVALFAQQIINISFIGHKYEGKERKDIIDGIGISHLYINCCVLSFAVGIVTGFETLGSNAYGVKKYYLLGLYFHRAQIIGYTLVTTLLLINYFIADKVIALTGVDENVMQYVRTYIKIAIFFVFFDIQFNANFRYLNIAGKSYVNLILLLGTLLLHPVWCYLFIIYFDFGIQGAAFSLLLSQFINAFLGYIYILWVKPIPGSIFFFRKESFKGWYEYLRISIPSAFLTCAEWWAFEILSIIAIWIGKLDYTVHILINSLYSLLVPLSIGFGMATTILIGKNISKGNLKLVKKYAYVCVGFAFSTMFICSAVLFIFRNSALYIFMDEPDVVEKGTKVVGILCIVGIFEISQSIFQSICRGLGKQLIASAVAFVGFYIFQASLAILFGKVWDFGVLGIWIGVCISCILSNIFFLIVIYSFDLEKIKQDVRKRLDRDSAIGTHDAIIRRRSSL